MEETMLNLRWDFFSSHLASTLDFCYEKQHFVDLSLVCKNNVTFKCHKMILSATSGFFRGLLTLNDHPHPLIILHDINPEDLKAVLNFMYYGEIEVPESHVSRLVKVARVLDIAGLKDLQPGGQFSDSLPVEQIDVKKEPVSFQDKNEILIDKLEEQKVNKKFYNLRQRNYFKQSDDSYKKNKRRKEEEKFEMKNGSKEKDCNYLKKLKMLDEVEIIFQPQDNCGVFIKDELDISDDSQEKNSKICLGPGVEIFKIYPWKPGTSKEFC